MEGEETAPQSSGCCFTVKDICKRICQRIADSRPVIVPEDSEIRLWYKRARCNRFDLLFPFLAAAFYVVDVGMDLELAVTYYNSGNLRWAAYTLGIVVFSLIVIEFVSIIWYRDDQKHPGKGRLLKQNGLEVKSWFYACHFFFFGRILRCWQIFKTVRLIRRIKEETSADMWRCRLYIAQLHDSSNLALLEAFTEETPQITLQLYILLKKGSLDLSSFQDVFVLLNIIKSLLFFAHNWLSYARKLRLKDHDSQLLQLCSFGSFAYFSWRLFLLVSRILALVLFASLFKGWVFLIAGIHYILSCLILHSQQCDYFENKPIKQWFFKYIIIASIYIFSFFPLESKNTRKAGIPFYLLTFAENSTMAMLWFVFSDYDLGLRVAVLFAEWGTFFIGLLALVLYYCCFHPSIRKPVVYEKDNVCGKHSGVIYVSSV